MLRRLSSSRPRLLAAVATGAGLAAVATGCRGGGDAQATERLWVSGVPTSPKAPLTAFLATKATDGKYIGAFFVGSMYRGGHNVFSWHPKKKGNATLQFLQDGREVSVRIESCTPTTGFDYCMLMVGDPTGTKRYQSRKRWTTRRKASEADLAGGLVRQAMVDLSDEDEDLRALVER